VILYGTALLVFVADRLTKLLVQRMAPHSSIPLLGGLVAIDRTQNTGAAFSVGLGMGNLFLAFAVVAAVAIVVFSRRLPSTETWGRVALGMVLGGALGNALDRVLQGSVTDFIDLHWWPVFNVADSCIVVAALILAWRLGRKPAAGDA
jgi:signal peptidase II